MKRLLLFALCGVLSAQSGLTMLGAGGPVSGGNPNGYTKGALFTFNVHPASSLTAFPNLVLGTYSQLADVAHGGFVTHTTTLLGQTVPADLIFTSDSAGSTLLSWEIESWDNTTGAIVAWVKDDRSSSADTLIYAWVGKSSVATYQCTASATWDSNYLAVYHFASAASAIDSKSGYTGTAETGYLSYPAEVTGQVNGAANSGSGLGYGYFQTATEASLGPAAITVSAWFNPSGVSGFQNIAGWQGYNGWALLLYNNNVAFWYDTGYGPTSTATVGASVWSYAVGTGDASGSTIYVAGAPSGTNGTALAYVGAPYPLNIFNNGVTQWFTGAIDEVRISNCVRSADWIAHEYRQQAQASAWYTVGSWTP